MSGTRPSLSDSFAKTLNRFRARGAGEVVALGFERTREWWSSTGELVVFVRDAAPGDNDGPPGFTFRGAEPGDADRYARDIGTDSPATFRTRLTQDTRCFVVDDGASLMHASWVTTSGAWTRELKARLTPPPGDAYIYESFTRPEARGHGIYPFALRQIASWGAGAGIGRVWVAAETDNPSSVRAITKAGFDEAFRVAFSRRLGRVRVGDPTGPRASEGRDFLS